MGKGTTLRASLRLSRMSSRRYYIVVALTVTLFITLVAAVGSHRMAVQQLIRVNEQDSVTFAQHVWVEIWPQHMSVSELRDPEFLAALERNLRLHMQTAEVILARVYDTQGQVVLSIPESVAEKPEPPEIVVRVLQGEVIAKFVEAEKLVAEGHIEPGVLPPYVVETWLPIRIAPDAPPVGVLALYRDVTDIYLWSQQSADRLLLFLLSVIGLVFLSLSVVAYRVQAMLDRRTDILESLLRLIAIAHRVENLDTLTRDILEIVVSVLDVPMGALWIRGHVALHGFPPQAREVARHLIQQRTDIDIRNTVVVNNVSRASLPSPQDVVIRTYADRFDLKAVIVVPVCTHDGTRVGGLVVADRRPRRWLPEQIYFLEVTGQELGVLAERLHLIGRLQEALEVREAMIRNVSHELRTPLALIYGYLELLQDGMLGSLNEEQREAVDIMLRNAERLHFMVERLVQMRLLEAATLEKTTFDLAGWLRNIVDEWKVRAENAGIALQVALPADTLPVHADPKLLYMVVQNLLDNAIKFSPQGGTITVRAWSENDNVHITVSDEGIGIPPDKLERIFEKFYQVDLSTTRRFGGMGIGLALCKEIVELHGGRIWAESEGEGRGATFHVVLPRRHVSVATSAVESLGSS